MSQRKPMGAYWAILATRDELLSGGQRILLAKMYLLDNGDRGCSAPAAKLGAWCGLTEGTAEKYRRELGELGLVYRVTGTRTWHVTLPSGLPVDRATDEQVQAYARQIDAFLRNGKPTPAFVIPADETRTDGTTEPEPPFGETGTSVRRNRNGHPDRRSASEPTAIRTVIRDSVPELVTTDARFDAFPLMSTQETRETALMSADAHAPAQTTSENCERCGKPLQHTTGGRVIPCRCA